MPALLVWEKGPPCARPVATLALAGLLLAFFAAAHTGELGRLSVEARSLMEGAVATFEERPDLAIDDRLRTRIGADRVRQLRARFAAGSRDDALPEVRELLARRGQRRIDELLSRVRALESGLPPASLGVRGPGSPPGNFGAHVFVHKSALALGVTLLFLLAIGSALEDCWGSVWVCSLFAAGAVVPAVVYARLAPDGAAPWIGAGGVVATLLGAYAIQSAGRPARLFGALALPGVVVLAAWLITEYAGLRGAFGRPVERVVPLAHFAGLALGVATGGLLRRLHVHEKRRARRGGEIRRARRDRVAKALEAHRKGRSTFALHCLELEYAAAPREREVAILFWKVAVESGNPQRGAAVLLSAIRASLRLGRFDQAVDDWLEFEAAGSPVEVEPALRMRMAEILLDESRPDAALRALAFLVETPSLSLALALRVVRAARDFDPDTTARAARLGLAHPQLDGAAREEFEALCGEDRPGSATPVNDGSDRAGTQSIESDVSDATDATPLVPASPAAIPDRTTPGSDNPAPAEPAEIDNSPLRRARIRIALPVGLDDEALVLDVEGRGKYRLRYARLEAIAVAAVGGLGPRPILVLDLVVNWRAPQHEPLNVLRVRSDRFDPRVIFPQADAALGAFRQLTGVLLERSGAQPLPGFAAVAGGDFAVFPDLTSYHGDVLSVVDPRVASVDEPPGVAATRSSEEA